jgi:hypothetical protein
VIYTEQASVANGDGSEVLPLQKAPRLRVLMFAILLFHWMDEMELVKMEELAMTLLLSILLACVCIAFAPCCVWLPRTLQIPHPLFVLISTR